MARNVSRFDAALAAGNLSLATDVEHGIEHFCTGAAGVNAYARLADSGTECAQWHCGSHGLNSHFRVRL